MAEIIFWGQDFVQYKARVTGHMQLIYHIIRATLYEQSESLDSD